MIFDDMQSNAESQFKYFEISFHVKYIKHEHFTHIALVITEIVCYVVLHYL